MFKKCLVNFLIVLTLIAPGEYVLAQEAGITPAENSAPIPSEGLVPSDPTPLPTPAPEPEANITIPELGPSVPDPTPEATTPSEVMPGEPTPAEGTPSDTEPTPPKKDEEPPPPESSAAMSAGDISGGAGGTANTIKQILPDIDKTTGALVFNFPINVPPGRNGIQPNLALSYNSLSQDPSSIFGPGWSDNIPYIRRINRKGVDKLYSENYFESSFSGELVSASSSASYYPKVENGDFMRYEKASSTWTVTDKLGKIYSFGMSANSRQDDPSSSTAVFAWMLSEVRDLNGNYITYEYFKDAGQIYPSSTVYTQYGTSTPAFRVDFNREVRPDPWLKFNMGFAATSTYRISEILAKYSGSLVRKYTISYASSTTSGHQLLDTITESGTTFSSSTTILPSTDFDYQGNDGIFNSQWFSCPANYDTTQGVILADVNADGYVDIMRSTDAASSTYLNDTNLDWTSSAVFAPPLIFWDNSTSTKDRGVRAVDINGDGRVDLVKRLDHNTSSEQAVYLNSTTSLGWVQSFDWNVPAAIVVDGVSDNQVRFVDINGDGLPDFIKTYSGGYGIVTEVYLNNGYGWVTDSGWNSPVNLNNRTLMADVNNDGLIDIMQSYDSGGAWIRRTYLNSGQKSWSGVSEFLPPAKFDIGGLDQGVREADFNGDGYSDLIQAKNDVGQYVFLNRGRNWVQTSWSPSWYFIHNNADTGFRLADIGGDGMIDALSCSNASDYLYHNPSIKADLISHIKLPHGGTTSVAYKLTSQFKNGSTLLNPNLPFIVDAVDTISRDDGFGTISNQAFSYEDGRQHYAGPYDRKMAGFAKVISTNSASTTTSYFFHQGDTSSSTIGEYDDHFSKIGKVYRTEVADSAGNIYSKVINKWDHIASSTTNFVNLIQALALTYDGDADHKDKAESYSYATSTGNLTQKIEWGEVTGSDDGTFSDAGSDLRTTSVSYASNSADYVFGLPSVETITNASSTKLKENRYYYDSGSLGTVDNGNLTKEEFWKGSSTYMDTEKTYNGYGLVIQQKDPRNKATNFTYDTNNLYPATSTNALSQSTGYLYDYPSGQVTQRKDPNGSILQSIFDGLGRLVEEKQPDLNSTSTLITKTTVAYTDSYNASNILRTNYLQASTSTVAYTYLDGFGRTIQTRSEAEGSDTFVAADTVYNNLERIQKESLPYFSTGSSRTTANSTSSIYIQYTYDPMLRVASTTNAVGTVHKAYDDWKTTITDARGKPKILYNDAYGNLIKVDEFNSSSTYTTSYQYDLVNNLEKITDALGNERDFTYDNLNRRTIAEDLHLATSSADIWRYSYDDSSNLTLTIDPKSQRVDYSYDDINRPLTENYVSQGGTEQTYIYDNCTYGIGRLCTATSTTGIMTQWLYNALGGIARETKTVSSTAYHTDYTYDRQGNVLTITNPDGSVVTNIYNTAGQLEAALEKELGYATTTIVSNINYAPTGKPTIIEYGNGVKTIYTYDKTKMYRLTNIFTEKY